MDATNKPLNVNTASKEEKLAISGIGERQVGKLMKKRTKAN